MAKARTHFEQIPVAKIAKLVSHGTKRNKKSLNRRQCLLERPTGKTEPYSVPAFAERAAKERS